jgi:hypothetical protein
MKSLHALAGTFALTCLLFARATDAQGISGGKYAIQTMKGNYLTAVNGGGVSGRNAINTDAIRIAGWETFTLVAFSDGKHAIQTATSNYVTALNGGGISGKVALHTDAKTVNAWEKFTFVDQRDGTYAIRTSNNFYLTALNGGGIGGGNIAIHTNATQVSGWEKFKLVRLDAAPVCNANIQNVWWYLTGSSTVAFFPLSANTWAAKEISYGDPNRRDYWGSYACIGANTWEFKNANGAVYQRLALRTDGTLYNAATNEVFHR